MAKSLLLGVAMALAVASGVNAQSAPATSDGGVGVRSGNITATGETVPNPGASQGAGTTDLDRGIQHEDTKIQNSICKGC